MQKKLTKTVVDDAAAEGGKDLWVWDAKTTGFGLRVRPNGRKVYVVEYRPGEGGRSAAKRRFTIGPHGSPWTVETARAEARRVLSLVEQGKDPAAEKQADKKSETMSDLCQRFLDEHAAEHKKASSAAADQRNIRNHVLPLMGKLRVKDVSRIDVDRFKRAVAQGKTAREERSEAGALLLRVQGGQGAANRCLALVSKMLNLAERWGIRPDGSNPCRNVEKYRERKCERLLSAEELARLGDALSAYAGSPYATAAVKLLVFTGARLREVLGLRWEWIDFDRGEARLPDSKTGAKTLHLPPPAMAVLAGLPRVDGNPYVIVGGVEGACLVNLEKPWRAIRAAAGLDDVRLHDLRHAFASVAACSGMALPIIGKMLGHTQAQTTQRYAHLSADPIKAAAATVAGKIDDAMRGNRPSAEVVEMPKRKA
jgi:integrase